MSSTNYTLINNHFNGLHFHKVFHTDNRHVMYIQHQYLHHNIQQKEVSESWIWRPSIANINAHYQITARMLFWCNINLIITIVNANLFDKNHRLHIFWNTIRSFRCLDVKFFQPQHSFRSCHLYSVWTVVF